MHLGIGYNSSVPHDMGKEGPTPQFTFVGAFEMGRPCGCDALGLSRKRT